MKIFRFTLSYTKYVTVRFLQKIDQTEKSNLSLYQCKKNIESENNFAFLRAKYSMIKLNKI